MATPKMAPISHQPQDIVGVGVSTLTASAPNESEKKRCVSNQKVVREDRPWKESSQGSTLYLYWQFYFQHTMQRRQQHLDI
ncbi:hypothetical protein BDD12DRAFT_154093 [Trichophaea hybrida]|nr:hypothetical protein BDD12DRAFT_154093 [Trichophaea hybrida]